MYAAILNNIVIDVQEDYRDYPPTITGDEIITIECPDEVKIGDEYDSAMEEFIVAPVEPLMCFSSGSDEEDSTNKDTEEKN